MLSAQRTHLFSSNYTIRDGQREVTEVSLRWFREAGSFELDGKSFKVGREGLASGSFVVACDGEWIAAANKPSAFRRRFEVQHAGESYELVAPSVWARTYELRRGARCIGTIRRTSWWSHAARIDLPEDLPLEVRVFLTWLVLVMWKRSEQSSS